MARLYDHGGGGGDDDDDDDDDEDDDDDDDDDDDVACECFCNEQIHASFNLSVYVYSFILLQFIYGSTGRN